MEFTPETLFDVDGKRCRNPWAPVMHSLGFADLALAAKPTAAQARGRWL